MITTQLNTNRLEKDPSFVVIQEYDPGFPGIPAMEGYWTTETTFKAKEYTIVEKTSNYNMDIDTGDTEFINSTQYVRKVNCSEATTKRVWVPPRAEVPPIPETLAVLEEAVNWNAGAISNPVIPSSTNFGFHFQVSDKMRGSLVGIGPEGSLNEFYGLEDKPEFQSIFSGVYFEQKKDYFGNPSTIGKIYQKRKIDGVYQTITTGSFAHLPGNLYTLERINGLTKLFVNSIEVYQYASETSVDSSIYASLFEGGDAIVNATYYEIQPDLSNSVETTPVFENTEGTIPVVDYIQEDASNLAPEVVSGLASFPMFTALGSGTEQWAVYGGVPYPDLSAFGYETPVSTSIKIPLPLFVAAGGQQGERVAYVDENGVTQYAIIGTKTGLTYKTNIYDAYSVIADGALVNTGSMSISYQPSYSVNAYGAGVGYIASNAYKMTASGELIGQAYAYATYGSYRASADGLLIEPGEAIVSHGDYRAYGYSAGEFIGSYKARPTVVSTGELQQVSAAFVNYKKYKVSASGYLLITGEAYFKGGRMVAVPENNLYTKYGDYDVIALGELDE